MSDPEYRYPFEESNRRKTKEAAEHLGTFKKRLGLPHRKLPQGDAALIECITACHLNIVWYERSIEREKEYQRLFLLLSVVLLVGLPLGVLAVPQWFKFGKGVESIVPAVTALLTGLVAIQRSFAAWFSKRSVIGQFWRASSELKSQLYEFEDRWKGEPPLAKVSDEFEGQLTPEFKKALEDATRKARETVRVETQQFYEQYSMPGLDIAKQLKESKQQVQELSGLFVASRMRREQARIKREQAVQTQVATIRGLERLRDGALEQLDAGPTDSRKTAIESALKSYEAELRSARIQLAKLEAQRDHPIANDGA